MCRHLVSAPIIAAELGARKHAVRQVRRSFRMAMWLSVLATLPFIVLLSQGERLMLLAHQDAEVAARSGHFLMILLLAMIPAVMSGAMRVTASALGRPGWATAITAMASTAIVASVALAAPVPAAKPIKPKMTATL